METTTDRHTATATPEVAGQAPTGQQAPLRHSGAISERLRAFREHIAAGLARFNAEQEQAWWPWRGVWCVLADEPGRKAVGL